MNEEPSMVLPKELTIIKPPRGWFYLDLRELWNYRELAYFFVWRDLKVRYKQTVLGGLWAIFQPFIAMVVFSVFFGRFIKVPSDGVPYPIFVYTGLILWNYFSFGLNHASNSMIENAGIIQKIYFPRLIIPIASSLTGLIDFFIAALILIGLAAYYHFVPSLTALFLIPMLILITFFSSVGIGSFLASLNVKYRDVRYLIPFFVQMMMFITPVIYPLSIVGERYKWLLALNPMASVITTARAAMFHSGSIDFSMLGFAGLISIVLFIIGVVYFRKMERFFADII